MAESLPDEAVTAVSMTLEKEDERSPIQAHAVELVPELDSYQWRDEYFNANMEHKDAIIAVFDHSPLETVRDQIMNILACIFFSVFPLLVLEILYGASSSIINFIFWIAVFTTCFGHPVSEITMCCLLRFWMVMFPPAHTAVTQHGIIHVTSVGLFNRSAMHYFVPFRDMVGISQQPYERNDQVVSITAVIGLWNNLSTYLVDPGQHFNTAMQTMSIQHLCRSSLFVKVVMALKDDVSQALTVDKVDTPSTNPSEIAETMQPTGCSSSDAQGATCREDKQTLSSDLDHSIV